MKPIRTRTARAIAVAIVVGSLALTGCSSDNGGGSKGKDDAKSQKDAAEQQDPVAYGDAAASAGPAKEVPGAKSGGFINVYMQSDLTHMDPGQIYVSDSRPVRQPDPRSDELRGGRRRQPDGRR